MARNNEETNPFALLESIREANPKGLAAGNVAQEIHHSGERTANLEAAGNITVVSDLASDNLVYHEESVRRTTIVTDPASNGIVAESVSVGRMVDRGNSSLDISRGSQPMWDESAERHRSSQNSKAVKSCTAAGKYLGKGYSRQELKF